MKSLTTLLFSRRVAAVTFALSLAPLCFAETQSTELNPAPEISYGDVYLIEQREQKSGSWQLGAAYTYGFSNPYIAVHGVQPEGNLRLGEFFMIGVAPTVFTTSDKGLASELQRELGLQNIQSKIFRPLYSAHAQVSVLPLSGMLNWFGTNAVRFDLRAGVGFGGTQFSDSTGVAPSAKLFLLPEVHLSRHFGLNAGLQVVFDRLPQSAWQNRVDTLVGVVGRL
jgi:hypothetical protein